VIGAGCIIAEEIEAGMKVTIDNKLLYEKIIFTDNNGVKSNGTKNV
jgi:hypothetical protein